MTLERLADFQSAQNGRLGAIAKDQGAAVARWQPKQFAFCFGLFELFSAANKLSKRLHLVALVANQQLRVANDVDEQDMTDLKFDL
jgi:hypothetical protein